MTERGFHSSKNCHHAEINRIVRPHLLSPILTSVLILFIPSELERQANIARNQALLESLNLKDATANIVSRKREIENEKRAKPIQPAKKIKREKLAIQEPRRQSLRLRKPVIDPNESPAKKRKREVS